MQKIFLDELRCPVTRLFRPLFNVRRCLQFRPFHALVAGNPWCDVGVPTRNLPVTLALTLPSATLDATLTADSLAVTSPSVPKR